MSLSNKKKQALAARNVAKRISVRQLKEHKLLTIWKGEADRRAKFLKAELVWDLMYEHLQKARQYGIEEELRSICWVASGKMADPRMLKLTARYEKR